VELHQLLPVPARARVADAPPLVRHRPRAADGLLPDAAAAQPRAGRDVPVGGGARPGHPAAVRRLGRGRGAARVGRRAALALEAVWVAGLTAATLAFGRLRMSVPVGSVNFLVSGDMFHYFWPAYAYIAERLRAGGLAQWNPYQSLGEPFLATLQAGT